MVQQIYQVICLLTGAASRGGDDSRGTAELTKAVTASSNSSEHVSPSQSANPSTPAPTGAPNLAALAPTTTGTGGGAAAGSGHTFSYRHHHDHHSESNEWDVKNWNEERERDRETWIHDPEWLRVESWLDEHPDFCLDYFLRLVHRFNYLTRLVCIRLCGIDVIKGFGKKKHKNRVLGIPVNNSSLFQYETNSGRDSLAKCRVGVPFRLLGPCCRPPDPAYTMSVLTATVIGRCPKKRNFLFGPAGQPVKREKKTKAWCNLLTGPFRTDGRLGGWPSSYSRHGLDPNVSST